MDEQKIHVIGIAGSLRKASYNRRLLAAAERLMPEYATLEIMPIDVIPLYDGDLEASSGIPRPVTALKDAIAGADGLLIATPEYNAGMPGVLKNVIDWVSRPGSDIPRVLHGKPVALMGATPGGFGTTFSQTAWLPVFRRLRMELWTGGGGLYVSRAGTVIDDEGGLDEELEARLRAFVTGFVDSLR